LLGKPVEHGEIQVEGGEYPSIFNWEERLRSTTQRTPEPHEVNSDGGEDSRPPSSGLSSLGDRSIADEMDMS